MGCVGRTLTAVAIVALGGVGSAFGLHMTRSSDARPVPAIEVVDVERARERSTRRPTRVKRRSAVKKASGTRPAAHRSRVASRPIPTQRAATVSSVRARSRVDRPSPSNSRSGAPAVPIVPVPITPVPAGIKEADPNTGNDTGDDQTDDGTEPPVEAPDADGD
jgi:hypothetical protein